MSASTPYIKTLNPQISKLQNPQRPSTAAVHRSGFPRGRFQPSKMIKNPPKIYKQNSCSLDSFREEAWLRRKDNQRRKQSRSLTEDDLDELKGCIELGFGFETTSSEIDQRLSDAIPALELYYAVNKQYHDVVSKTSSDSSASSAVSDCESPVSEDSPSSIFGSGASPRKMKTRLRQWAQLVACSMRQSRR